MKQRLREHALCSHNYLGSDDKTCCNPKSDTMLARIECKFWLGDDCWNGSSDHPPIAVQAGTFEQAKSDMEMALGKHIESLLHEGRSASKEQAA